LQGFSYIFYLYSFTDNRGKPLLPEQTFLSFLSGLSVVLYIHLSVGFVIWLGFLVQVYVTCFKTIGDAFKVEFNGQNNGSIFELKEVEAWERRHEEKVSCEKIQKLLFLYERVCESIKDFNKFYALPIMIDVCICVSLSFNCIYSVNRLLYFYENSNEVVDENQSLEILLRFPSQIGLIARIIYLAMASNNVTLESAKVVEDLQEMAPKSKSALSNFMIQSQVRLICA
jgi:hypothetical protein